jgi:hypothetical protein
LNLQDLSDRFEGPAKMSGEERLGYCDAVPFVRINDVDYRNILGPHRGNDRIAFGDFTAYIVGAVKDQRL